MKYRGQFYEQQIAKIIKWKIIQMNVSTTLCISEDTINKVISKM